MAWLYALRETSGRTAPARAGRTRPAVRTHRNPAVAPRGRPADPSSRYACPVKRRGITLVVGLAILLALVGLVSAGTVPYVELGPGPTVNTLGTDSGHDVIQISGTPTTSSAGQLRLVTVNVQSDISMWAALRGWLQSDYAVVPIEVIYPPNLSRDQVDKQNANDFKASQTSAETAALRELGYPVRVTVDEVLAGAPASGKLQAGDVIDSVDGHTVTSQQKLVEEIQAKPVGSSLRIGYTRAGAANTVTIVTTAGTGKKPQVGIKVKQEQPHPFTISIDLDKIGGPSAGLMFTLGIVDKVRAPDLTGGRNIAGTGTIDDDGNVGPIGGVPQKLLGAKAAHATVFLTPAANCAEAVANAQPGLKLVKVSTLDDALAALTALRENRQPTLCTR